MLYLSAIVLSFFLAAVLLTKHKKTQADFILIAWVAITGFHLLTYYLFSTGRANEFPTWITLGFPLPLIQGPFLYLYTRRQTSLQPLSPIQLFHFLPVVISYLLFSRFFMLTFEQKVVVYLQQGRGFETVMTINLVAIYLSGIVYSILSLLRLLTYRRKIVDQFSNTERINFNWLLYLILWEMFIWIVIIFNRENKFIYGAASLFILWLSYFGIKQVQVFSDSGRISNKKNFDGGDNTSDEKIESEQSESLREAQAISYNTTPAKSKYQGSNLSETTASDIHLRLKEFLAEQKPYKNPDLTLNELAAALHVHPNHLSQVINSKEKRNFYDLINEKRVKEFIDVMSQPASRQFTLLAIALDCGFNSKASFNRNFKKFTGQAPSDFVKNQPKGI